MKCRPIAAFLTHYTYNFVVKYLQYVSMEIVWGRYTRGSQMKTEHPLQSDNGIGFIQKQLPEVLIHLSHWET